MAGYYVIVATAGNDTTSASIAGGLHALMQFPDQLERLVSDPSMVSSTVEEMIRRLSPVKQFMRTAAVDNNFRGVRIPAGDSVLLSFPSANRDEDIFENPERFDIGRDLIGISPSALGPTSASGHSWRDSRQRLSSPSGFLASAQWRWPGSRHTRRPSSSADPSISPIRYTQS